MSKGERLAHDVAKYIARTAQNVHGEVPSALVPLLLRDWYGVDGQPTPLELFLGSADALNAADREFCEDAFANLLALRGQAEAGQAEALSEGVGLALAIAERIERAVRKEVRR